MVSINAIIENVTFGFNDFNCFTVNLHLKMSSGGVSALGTINIGSITPEDNLRFKENGNYMGYFFAKIFQVAGVKKYEDLIGSPIRAIFKKDGRAGDTCIGIQNFLSDKVFFIPSLVNGTIPDDMDLSGILDEWDYEQFYSDVENNRISQNIKYKK